MNTTTLHPLLAAIGRCLPRERRVRSRDEPPGLVHLLAEERERAICSRQRACCEEFEREMQAAANRARLARYFSRRDAVLLEHRTTLAVFDRFDVVERPRYLRNVKRRLLPAEGWRWWLRRQWRLVEAPIAPLRLIRP